jgi:two-component system cell cycle response regulator CpdR
VANILLAEDDSAMRHFLAGALTKAGHNVRACPDGLDAMAVLEQDVPLDLLLTDIVMPGMDGMELSRKAAKCRPDIKIMFITGFAAVALSEQHKSEPHKPGAQPRVLSKPFHLGELVEQVRQALDEDEDES